MLVWGTSGNMNKTLPKLLLLITLLVLGATIWAAKSDALFSGASKADLIVPTQAPTLVVNKKVSEVIPANGFSNPLNGIWLPSDFKVSQIQNGANHNEASVQIKYVNSTDESFLITKTPSHNFEQLPPEESSVLKRVTINGFEAYAYDTGGPREMPPENRAVLVWNDGSNWFEIANLGTSRSLNVETMIKIAESIK